MNPAPDAALRDVAPADLAAVHALNEAAVPAVNSIAREAFRRFARDSAYFRVAEEGGTILGFLLGRTPEAEYNSPNFVWFRERYPDFVYVDRIVVGEAAQGTGLGRRFYGRFEEFGRERGSPILACEVNLRPRNERSLRFHHRFGFTEVGRQETEEGRKLVSLMVKEIGPRAGAP